MPDNQKFIKEHIVKYNVRNVELLPYAVSDTKGVSHFYVSSGKPKDQPNGLDWDFGNKSSSLLLPNENNSPEWLDFKEKINVETITLNDFFVEKELDGIDFVHMDVQGAELKVLKGAKKYLNKVKAIWLEVSNIELYKGQPLTSDIEDFMKSRGFELIKSEFEGQVGDQFYLNENYFKAVSLFNGKFQWYFKKSTKISY